MPWKLESRNGWKCSTFGMVGRGWAVETLCIDRSTYALLHSPGYAMYQMLICGLVCNLKGPETILAAGPQLPISISGAFKTAWTQKWFAIFCLLIHLLALSPLFSHISHLFILFKATCAFEQHLLSIHARNSFLKTTQIISSSR